MKVFWISLIVIVIIIVIYYFSKTNKNSVNSTINTTESNNLRLKNIQYKVVNNARVFEWFKHMQPTYPISELRIGSYVTGPLFTAPEPFSMGTLSGNVNYISYIKIGSNQYIKKSDTIEV